MIKGRHEADRRAALAEAELRQAEDALRLARQQAEVLTHQIAEIHGSGSWRALAMYRGLRAKLKL